MGKAFPLSKLVLSFPFSTPGVTFSKKSKCKESFEKCFLLCPMVGIKLTPNIYMCRRLHACTICTWFDCDRTKLLSDILTLFRNMKELLYFGLVAFCLGVPEALECSSSYLVWIYMKRSTWEPRHLMYPLKRYSTVLQYTCTGHMQLHTCLNIIYVKSKCSNHICVAIN